MTHSFEQAPQALTDFFQHKRQEFPALKQKVHDTEALIYFDNAATTQKPQAVIDALVTYYQQDNANIHRGVHTLAQRATEQYEAARQTVSDFINSHDASEIIFNSGTTAGVNFLARGLVEPQLSAGDQVMVTVLEHHSNLVPWQEVCQRTGAQLVYAPLDAASGLVDLQALAQQDTSRLKVIAIQHVSNVLGLEQPIKALTQWAKAKDILVLVDGAQAVAHLPVDVQDLGVDAYCFSGHKLFAPTGIGVCYLHHQQHKHTQPTLFGGEMIHQVDDFHSNYKQAPWKFEAGTPPIAQAIALAAAIRYIEALGWSQLQAYEASLTQQLTIGLEAIEGLQLYHPKQQTDFHGILSFNLAGIHPHDAATGYDLEGIALRAGHHCAQPLMRHLKVPATLRASLCFYNTPAEVAHFIQATRAIKEFFAYGFK